jgi:hypothetical protein
MNGGIQNNTYIGNKQVVLLSRPRKKWLKSARSYVVVYRTLRVEFLGREGSKISATNNFVQKLPQKRQIESNTDGQ